MALDRVVVGVDGSEGAGQALEWCVDLESLLEIEILAVHALSPLVEWELSLPPFNSDDWVRAATREFREKWCQPLRDAEVVHRTMVVDDYPVPALRKVAEDYAADLIVVGAHGHSGLRDRLVGGVSRKLVQTARVPVVVIPPDSPPPPGLDYGRAEHRWPAGSP